MFSVIITRVSYDFSKLFHSLVQLALSGGTDIGAKEEAISCYSEIIDVVENKAQVRPHLKISVCSPPTIHK